MGLDAMLGKSSVGWETKIPVIASDVARRNSSRFDRESKGMTQPGHKPYRIPGASLLSRTKAGGNK